jgi:general secretion pathway protein G
MVKLMKNKEAGAIRAGFTLIELLVVLAIVATLLTLAAPRYFHGVDRSKEVVLENNLNRLRSTIDEFYGDKGRYPDSLEQLVEMRYLRALPVDPVTESTTTWILIPPLKQSAQGKIYNVKSGAQGNNSQGIPYSSL